MTFSDGTVLSLSSYIADSKHDGADESLLPQDAPYPNYPRRSRYRILGIIGSHAVTFIIAVALSTLIIPPSLWALPGTALQPATKHLHCGNSTMEARERGCVFDVLTNMWVPEQCWDREGTEEFMRTAPWQAYDQQDGKQRLSLEEMSERVGRFRLAPDPTLPPYWTPFREHVIHCALMWQRLHRGYLNGEANKLDFHSLNYQHTLHCSRSLMHMAGAGEHEPDPLDKIAIRTWVGFSECDVEV